MNETKLKMEAIERMKLVNLDSSVVKEFENENKLSCSNSINIIFSKVPNSPFKLTDLEPITNEMKKMVSKFEARSKSCLVYHVIYSETSFGVLYNLLYIDLEQEEHWNIEREDMKNGLVFSYVENITNPQFSEYGSIAVKEIAGALIREV